MSTTYSASDLVERRTGRPVTLRNDFMMYVKAMAGQNMDQMQRIREKAGVPGHDFSSGLAGLSGFREWRTLADKLTVVASLPINDPLARQLTIQTGTGTSYWVGDGKPIPVSQLTLAKATLRPLKVCSLTVVTDDMLTFSTTSDGRLGRQLARDLASGLNTAFLSEINSGVANVQPASITNGLTPLTASGTTPADVAADLALLVTTADEGGANLDTSVIVLSPSKAIAGAIASPDSGLSVRGGSYFGIPVIATPDALDDIVLIDWTGIAAGVGDVEMDRSKLTALQMLDNPTNDSTTPTATTMTSMFQTDSTAIRTTRYANWQRVVDTAVWFVQGPLS